MSTMTRLGVPVRLRVSTIRPLPTPPLIPPSTTGSSKCPGMPTPASVALVPSVAEVTICTR